MSAERIKVQEIITNAITRKSVDVKCGTTECSVGSHVITYLLTYSMLQSRS